MSLLDAIKNATAEDLQAIDDRIAALDTELAALLAARKVVAIAVNGKPERKPRGAGTTAAAKSAKSDEMERRRQAIHDLLSEEGSLPVPVIAKRLNIHATAVGWAVRDHEWFEIKNGEVHVAK